MSAVEMGPIEGASDTTSGARKHPYRGVPEKGKYVQAGGVVLHFPGGIGSGSVPCRSPNVAMLVFSPTS